MERKNMTNAEAAASLGILALALSSAPELSDAPRELMEAIAMGMMALEKGEEITNLYEEMDRSMEKAKKGESVWKNRNKNFFDDDLEIF